MMLQSAAQHAVSVDRSDHSLGSSWVCLPTQQWFLLLLHALQQPAGARGEWLQQLILPQWPPLQISVSMWTLSKCLGGAVLLLWVRHTHKLSLLFLSLTHTQTAISFEGYGQAHTHTAISF